MVRETRHLWIGNLPDNIREERILEHFKRYGKVQSVKILSKKDEDTPTVAATVAFIDIRSAAKAHNADNKIDERTLKTDYYEPPVSSAASSATCIYIHEKDDALGRPGAPPYTTPRAPRYAHCVPEERPYERPPHYYDRLGEREPYMRRPVGIGYHDDESYQARGRSRDRFTRTASGSIYQDGTDRNQGHFPRSHTQRQHFDQRYPPSLDQYGDEREAASAGPGRLSWRSTITSSSISSTVDSPPHSRSGSRQRRKGTSRRSSHSRSGSRSNSRSQSRSRSSSHSSSDSRSSSSSSKHRSSSTDSSSRSPSPSKSQSPATSYGSQGSGKTGRSDWPTNVVTTVSSLFLPPSVTTLNANSLSVGNQCSNQSQNCSSSPINNHSDKEERRPLGICVQNLPARSTDTSLKDGLFHEYKKHGKVTMVKVIGQGTDRYAVVCFKKADDVEKALEVSKDKLFFGCKIEVKAHEGLDGEDNEFRPFEADLDEFHPKATRTLFIGNLEKDITHLDLRKHFEQFGEIIEIDIKKQGATSTSLYAFIQFTNIASVVKAMRKLDGETLFGANRIKLGFGKSMPTCCVWIDGVVDSVSEKFLKRHFGRYGPVRNTVIDREKGQALVFYDSIDLAQNAVAEMRGRMLGSKRLQVDFASRECQTAFCEKLGLPGLELLPTDRLWERRDRREFDPLTDIRNFDEEYSQGSGASIEDSYEKELREYGYSQRERKEYGSDEQSIQGQSFSPLHRRDTNSISPSREKHRDNRSISPLARSERSSTRGSSRTGDDHHSRHGGKEEGSEDGEKKEGNKFSESTVKQEKKKCKQRNSASDLESHQSQSPPHSRQHSRSRSPPSKDKKSSKTKDRLNNRLKSPNSATWNSPSGDSVSNQEGVGFVSKETSVEQRHLQKHKLQEDKADLKDSVTTSLPSVTTAEVTADSVNKLKIKTETEHVRKRVHSNDFIEGHSKSDLLGQAERKRRLLSAGSLPSSRVTVVTQVQSREDSKSKTVNSIATDSFSAKSKKIETTITSNNRTTPSEHSSSVSEHLTISHVEKQSSSDSANLKHVNILQLLEQLQDKGSSSDTECSVENRKLSKEGKLKTNSEVNISDVVECSKISTKDSSCNTLGQKIVCNDDKTILSKVPGGLSYIRTSEKNGLPETTDTQVSRKPVDPRRCSEHHSVSSTSSLSAPQHMRKQSVYQAEPSLDHSSKKFSGLLPTSFTYVEGEIDSSKDPSSTSFFKFQSRLKEDEVSSSSDNATLPKMLRHSLSALPDLTRTFSPRLHSVSDEVTSAEHENKKGIIPLCLPLPKFAASLRSPKTSPNPLTSPKTIVSSPKSGHSPSLALTSKMLPPHILREPPKSVQLGSPEPIKEIEERLKPDNVNSSLAVLQQVVNNAENLVKITMPTDIHLKIEKNTEVASDSECSPISSPGCIEERIKALDEKFTAWSGSNTSRNLTATTVASTEAPLQPTIDYQKYNIKKRPKFDYMAPKPSEIMKTLLAKSTIFDQDLKRLEHINEKYEPKEINLDLSPKVKPFFRTKAAAKEFSSPIQPLTNVTNAIGQGSLAMNKLPVSSCIGTTTTLSPPLTPPTMGSTTTITTTNVTQNFVVNHVTHSISHQTIPFSPLTPVSAKISLPSPICFSTDSNLPQTKLATQYLNVTNFQNRTSNPQSPPFIKKESSISQSTAPCVSTIKKSMPFISTSLTPSISVTSESTQKDLFLPHCIKKESLEPKDISLKTKENFIKDIPSKEENLQGYKNREHGLQKESIKKEPFSFIETHMLKKESIISPQNDYLIDQNDSSGTIEDVKKEPLHNRFDMEISPVSQTGSNIKTAFFPSNWETDSTRHLQVTSECKIENKETQSHQSETKDQVNEPEPKRVKTHHTSSCKDIDKGDNKSSSPLQNESRKTEKKDKSSKSSDKFKSSVAKPENFVSLEKEETKGKSDMGKMKDDRKNKLKDNREISKHEGRVRTKSGDKGSEKNHGKNSQLTSNKVRKEHVERQKTKSERKSFDRGEKNQSGKTKSEDAPVYFSMYDKVKARSSHNQSLKDQASLESVRKKFNQLKKSRAKKGDKSRSADMDSDKDSDEFSNFSSDLESKPKPSSKLKQGKKRKLVIESSSDEELSQSAFHFETSRDTKIAENSSDLLSDSDKDIQDVTSSNVMPTSVKSKKKKKKKILSDVEASNSQIDMSPPHMKNKSSKPKTKQANSKSTKSKAMKSECESTDDEKTTKPKSKKKDFRKKRSKKDKITEIKSDSDLSDSDFSHFMVKRKEENRNIHMELKSDSESSDKEVFFHHNKDKNKTKDKIKIPELNFDSDFSVNNISHLSQTQAKEKAKKQYHELKYDSGLSESSTGLFSKGQKDKMKEQFKNENAGDCEPPPLMAVELNLDSKETTKGENNVKKDSKIIDDDQDKKQKPSPKKKKKSRKSTKGKEKKSNTTKGTCEKTKKTDNKARENTDNSSKTDNTVKLKYENSLSEPAESPPRLIPSIFSDIELRSDFSDYDFENQLSRNLSEQKSWNSNDVKNDLEKGIKNNFLGKNFGSSAKMNVEGKSFEEEDKGPPPLLENVDFDHRELDDSNKVSNTVEGNSNNTDQTNDKLVEEETKAKLEIHKEVNTSEDGSKKKKNLKAKPSIYDKNVSSKDEKRKKKNKKQTKEKKKKQKNIASKLQELSLTQLTAFPKSSSTEHFHPFDEDSRLSKDEKLDEEIVEEARRLEEELLADSEETCCFESDELPKLEDKHQERKFEEEAAKETQRLEQELFSTDSWHMKVSKPFQDECLQPDGLDDNGLNDSKVSDDETVKDEDIYADLDINPSSVRYPEPTSFLLQSEEQADFKLEEKSGVAEEMDKQQKMEDDLAVSALLQAMNGDDLPAPDLQKETDYLDSLLQPHPEEHTFNYLFQDSSSSGLVQNSGSVSESQEEIPEAKDDNNSHLFEEQMPTYSQNLNASYPPPVVNTSAKTYLEKSPKITIEEEEEERTGLKIQSVSMSPKKSELDAENSTVETKEKNELLLLESSLSENNHSDHVNIQVPQQSPESLFETVESSFPKSNSTEKDSKLSPQPCVTEDHDTNLDTQKADRSEVNKAIETSSQEPMHPKPWQLLKIPSVDQCESELSTKGENLTKVEHKKSRRRKKKEKFQCKQVYTDSIEEIKSPQLSDNLMKQENSIFHLDVTKLENTSPSNNDVETVQLCSSEKNYLTQQENVTSQFDVTKSEETSTEAVHLNNNEKNNMLENQEGFVDVTNKETTASNENESQETNLAKTQPEALLDEKKGHNSTEETSFVSITNEDDANQIESLSFEKENIDSVKVTKPEVSLPEDSNAEKDYLPSSSSINIDAEKGGGGCQLDTKDNEHKDQDVEEKANRTLIDKKCEDMTEENTKLDQEHFLPNMAYLKPKKRLERSRRGRRPKTRKYAESSLFVPRYEAKDFEHILPAITTRSGGRRRRFSSTDKNRRTLRSDTFESLMSAEDLAQSFADTEDSVDDQIPKSAVNNVAKVSANRNDDLVLNADIKNKSEECIFSTKTALSQEFNKESVASEDSQINSEKPSKVDVMEGTVESIKQEEPKKRRGRKKKGSTDHQPSPPHLPFACNAQKPDVKSGETENKDNQSKEPRLLLSLSTLEKSPDQKPQKGCGNAYDVFEFRDSEDEEITFEKDIQNSFKERMMDTSRTVAHTHEHKQSEAEKERKPEDLNHKTSHHEEKDMSGKEYVTELAQHGKIAITIRLHQKDGHDGSSSSTAEVVKTSQALCAEDTKPFLSLPTEKIKDEVPPTPPTTSDVFLTGPCKSTRKAIQLQSQISKTSVDEIIEEVVKRYFIHPDPSEGNIETAGSSQRISRRTRAHRRSEEIITRVEDTHQEIESPLTKHEPMFIIPDNVVKDPLSDPLKVCNTQAVITSTADSSGNSSEPETSKPETRMLLRSYRITRSTSRLESSCERSISPRGLSDQIQEPIVSQAEAKSPSMSISASNDSGPSVNPLPVLKVELPQLSSTIATQVVTTSVENTKVIEKKTESLPSLLEKDDDTDSRSSPIVLIDPVTGFLTPVNKKGEPTGVIRETSEVSDGSTTSSFTERRLTGSKSSVTTIVTHSSNTSTNSGVLTLLEHTGDTPGTTGTYPQVLNPIVIERKIKKQEKSSSSQITASKTQETQVITTNTTTESSLQSFKHGSVNMKHNSVISPTVTSSIPVSDYTGTTSPVTITSSMSCSNTSRKDLTIGQPFVPIAQPMPGLPSTASSPYTSSLVVSVHQSHRSLKSSVMTTSSSQASLPNYSPEVKTTTHNIADTSVGRARTVHEVPSLKAEGNSTIGHVDENVESVRTSTQAKTTITTHPPPSSEPKKSETSVLTCFSNISAPPSSKLTYTTSVEFTRTVQETAPKTLAVQPRVSMKQEMKGMSQPPIPSPSSMEPATTASTGKSGHPYAPKQSPSYYHQPTFPMGPHETTVHPGPSVLASTSSGGVIAELLQNPHLLQQRKEYLAAQHCVSAPGTQISERLTSQVCRSSGPGVGPIHGDIAVRLSNPTPPHTPTPPVTSSSHSLQAQELHSAHLAQGLHLRHPSQASLIMAPPPPLGIHPSDIPAYVHMYAAASHPHYAALHPELRAQHEAQARAAVAMGMTQRFGYPPIPTAAGFRQPVDPLIVHTALSEAKSENKSNQRTEEKPMSHKTTKVKQELKTPCTDHRSHEDHEQHQPHSSVESAKQHVITPGHPVGAGIQPSGHCSPAVHQLSPHISISQHERITDSPAVASPYASGQLRHPPSHLPVSRVEDSKSLECTPRLSLPKSEAESEMKPPAAHQNPPTTIPYHTLEMRGASGRSGPAIGAPAPGHLEGHPVPDRAHAVLSLKRDVPPHSREHHMVPGEPHPISDTLKKLPTHLIPYAHQSLPVSSGLHNLSTTSSPLPVTSVNPVLSPKGPVPSLRPPSASSSGGEVISSRRGSVHMIPQTGSEAPLSTPPPAHAMSQQTGVPRAQPQTPPHDSQVPPQGDSLLLQRYPVMWQGLLALKNDQAAVQMHFVSGNPLIAQASLPPMTEGGTPPVRIAQRMRLEQNQLEGVARKMQMLEEHCILLALPCGRDHMDVLQQSNNLRNGFINYLQLKQAAGIVNAAAPGSQQPAYVIHIFPSCDFSNENMARIAPDLLHSVSDIAHLLIIIATV
ncbi:msx2-interacting protein-like isoform X2 [Limulus polyphemus]|uniref:Msx2-interacting protein-like isoform X2 n=1 Tax=Limulus polyphemus TaxID=6850 RepID=A0ABM1T364_LIMPO|nr:msx2-interacting protein-like isoform X2 [Limulus polyphemus]